MITAEMLQIIPKIDISAPDKLAKFKTWQNDDGTIDSLRELYESQQGAQADGEENKMSASEALFSFAAWLTSFKTPVTFSGRHDASLAAQLVGEFCAANNLAEPRRCWPENFVWPTARPTLP